MVDEILQEVWDIKDQLAAECGYDIHRIAEQARQARPADAVEVPLEWLNRPRRSRLAMLLSLRPFLREYRKACKDIMKKP